MSTAVQRPGQVLARGSAWIAAGQAVSAAAGLVGSVAAARLLAPGDFGLMGVAMLLIAILQAFSQTGFERALVQRREVEGYLDVAWTVQVGRGVLLGALVLAAAWPLARFYAEPVLLPVLVVLSLSPFVQGFRSVAAVFFNRALDFRALFVVDAVRAALNLAITLGALLVLRSVWALVIGHVGASVVELVVSYVVHPHRPRFELNLPRARELLGYGKWITGMSVVGLVVTRGDDVFVSKYLGTTALGFYVLAYEISNLPATRITHVVGRVSFPTYARLNEDEDSGPLRAAFGNVMKATLLVSGPVSVLILLCIPSVVAHVIGAKWEPIVPLVRILAIAGFVRSVAALATGLFHAAGRPDLDFKMNVPRLLLVVGLIWPACRWGGLEGACWLVLLAVTSCLPTWAYGLRLLLGLRLRDVLAESALPAVTSAVLAASVTAASAVVPPSTLAAFALQLGLGLAAWLGAMWVIGRVSRLRLYSEIGRLVRALRPSSRAAAA